jgi:hypothetical protein
VAVTLTCESKKAAYSGFPTLGVPKVTDLIFTFEGRFSVRYSASSSASAPPSEWPTYTGEVNTFVGDETDRLAYSDDRGGTSAGE